MFLQMGGVGDGIRGPSSFGGHSSRWSHRPCGKCVLPVIVLIPLLPTSLIKLILYIAPYLEMLLCLAIIGTSGTSAQVSAWMYTSICMVLRRSWSHFHAEQLLIWAIQGDTYEGVSATQMTRHVVSKHICGAQKVLSKVLLALCAYFLSASVSHGMG
jgi:hypothetical protein